MNGTDYRKLCLDLFGTDDEDTLRAISEKARAKNARNAGRKKKFTEVEITNIRALAAKGIQINEIAAQFHTSRQVISKYINMPLTKKYPLRLTYMYRQRPCTIINVSFIEQKIKLENRTDDIFHRAFGVVEDPTWEDFMCFLQERCFPPTRANAKQLLRDLGIGSYDPLQIVEKTKGRMAEDEMWLKFDYFVYKG